MHTLASAISQQAVSIWVPPGGELGRFLSGAVAKTRQNTTRGPHKSRPMSTALRRCLRPWLRRVTRRTRAARGFPRHRYTRASEGPEFIRTEDVWVRRLEIGVYRVGITSKKAKELGGVGFVDICDEGTIIVPGRPLGMVEGQSGIFQIESPLSGEVVDRNEALNKRPEVLDDFAEDNERGWLLELDAACEEEDDEVEWAAHVKKFGDFNGEAASDGDAEDAGEPAAVAGESNTKVDS